MNVRASSVLAWAVAAATAAMAFGAIVLIAMTLDQPFFAGYGFRGYDVVFALAGGGLSLLILSRRPSHLVAWLGLASSMVLGLQSLGTQYAVFAQARGIDSPAATLADWLPGWIWVPSLLFTTLAILVFPDGRLPSPRWRAFTGSIVVAALAATALLAVASPYRPHPDVFAIAAQHPLRSIAAPAPLVVVVGLLGAFTALAVRRRGADVVVRQQIKWLMFAALLSGLAAALVVGALMLGLDPVVIQALELASLAAFALVPVSVAIAILRYRLYDIDLLINRTLVYGALTATLALAYGASVVLLQQLSRPITAGSDLAVAGSTLAVAALFQPVRRRIQSAVDRRFYRSKYDAQRTIAGFSARLRAEVDLDALQGELGAVVRETMQPAHVSLWLRRAER